APVGSSGNDQFGYTQFTITFSTAGIQDYTGTYSYLIAPDDGTTAIASPIWSIINGTLRKGAPMDQNADGKPDQNPLTTPFTGPMPAAVHAAPAPAPGLTRPFSGGASILTPPFNQNPLPLIVPGPQVASTQAIGANGPSTGGDNLLMNDTTSQFNV